MVRPEFGRRKPVLQRSLVATDERNSVVQYWAILFFKYGQADAPLSNVIFLRRLVKPNLITWRPRKGPKRRAQSGYKPCQHSKRSSRNMSRGLTSRARALTSTRGLSCRALILAGTPSDLPAAPQGHRAWRLATIQDSSLPLKSMQPQCEALAFPG